MRVNINEASLIATQEINNNVIKKIPGCKKIQTNVNKIKKMDVIILFLSSFDIKYFQNFFVFYDISLL